MYPPLFVPFILVVITEHGAGTCQAVSGPEKRRKWSIKCVVPQEEEANLVLNIKLSFILLLFPVLSITFYGQDLRGQYPKQGLLR